MIPASNSSTRFNDMVFKLKVIEILIERCYVSPNGVARLNDKRTWESTLKAFKKKDKDGKVYYDCEAFNYKGAIGDIVKLLEGSKAR